jgi:hypothetical protein
MRGNQQNATRGLWVARSQYNTLKNIYHSIPLASLLFFVILSAGLVISAVAQAGNEHNVGGFAWSGMSSGEAIGWISFNNVPVGGEPGGGGAISYGVNITTDGTMSGNAWAAVDKDGSSNPQGLGWITFDQAQLAGCPGGSNCRAWVTITPDASGKYWVNGWARVLFKDGTANSGGWDGWVHLNHFGDCDKNDDGKSEGGAGCPASATPVYGVYIDNAGDFHGFAWSDMVLGWINFNRANCNGTNCAANAAYRVKTTMTFKPDAKMECGGSSCPGGFCDNVDPNATWVMYPPTGCPGCVYQVLNTSTGNIQCTKWELVGTGYSFTDHSATKPGHTFQAVGLPGPGIYTLKLTVSDEPANNDDCTLGNSDTAMRQIQIKREVSADFECSLDNPADVPLADQVWANCNDANFKKKVIKDEIVFVRDASTPSEGATQINSYTWTINGATSNGPTASFTAAKANTLRLDIVDNYGGIGGPRNDCKTVTMGGKSLPEWIEVSPVGFIWQYLVANVSKIFTVL